jgi:glycolate oxidase FAD binding subunit
MLNDFIGLIRDASARGAPLRLRGGGTKDFYGQRLEGDILDTRGYRGIVAYEPTELFVTARCGTPLAELEATLAEKGQMLAFEPPHFGGSPGTQPPHFSGSPGTQPPHFGGERGTQPPHFGGPSPLTPLPQAGEGSAGLPSPSGRGIEGEGMATVGGCVAAGLSGPRRLAAGALRDFVLGVRVIDGKGEVLNFGGQVMKNVAGYDVSRLMAGALGTLGLIVEVTLKVLPKPAAEATLRLEMPEDRAIEAMNQWGGQPLPISALAWSDGELGVRLSGAQAAVRSAIERLGGERIDEAPAAAFWAGIREQTDPCFAGEEPLWRLSVPATAAPLALPGRQLVEWGGSLRWWKSAAEPFVMREAAAAAGGHATLFRGDRQSDVFHPLAPAVARIHRGLKQAFDPAGIFNRGRMYPDL